MLLQYASYSHQGKLNIPLGHTGRETLKMSLFLSVDSVTFWPVSRYADLEFPRNTLISKTHHERTPTKKKVESKKKQHTNILLSTQYDEQF